MLKRIPRAMVILTPAFNIAIALVSFSYQQTQCYKTEPLKYYARFNI